MSDQRTPEEELEQITRAIDSLNQRRRALEKTIAGARGRHIGFNVGDVVEWGRMGKRGTIACLYLSGGVLMARIRFSPEGLKSTHVALEVEQIRKAS